MAHVKERNHVKEDERVGSCYLIQTDSGQWEVNWKFIDQKMFTVFDTYDEAKSFAENLDRA